MWPENWDKLTALIIQQRPDILHGVSCLPSATGVNDIGIGVKMVQNLFKLSYQNGNTEERAYLPASYHMMSVGIAGQGLG